MTNDRSLLRFWYITYYISGALIPLMIVFGFIFNRFNIFNMFFSILSCALQFTMFLGLQLRRHQALFMYSTILLTLVHFSTIMYLCYMTQTLTSNIRQDLEKDISANHTHWKHSIQIKAYRCCRLDDSSTDKTSAYFQVNYPNHCGHNNHKACWPSFRSMTCLTKVIYWLTWSFQCLLLLIAWIYYFRIGKLSEQPRISPRKTIEQFYSEILVQTRPFKTLVKRHETTQVTTISKEDGDLEKSTISTSNVT